jgi:hypothetical protein
LTEAKSFVAMRRQNSRTVFSAVFTRTLALVRVLPNVRAKLPA